MEPSVSRVYGLCQGYMDQWNHPCQVYMDQWNHPYQGYGPMTLTLISHTNLLSSSFFPRSLSLPPTPPLLSPPLFPPLSLSPLPPHLTLYLSYCLVLSFQSPLFSLFNSANPYCWLFKSQYIDFATLSQPVLHVKVPFFTDCLNLNWCANFPDWCTHFPQ